MNEKQTSLSGQTGTSTMASGAGLTTSQTTSSAAEAGKAIVQDAKQVASEVAGQAKHQVATRLEDGKDKAAQGLSSVATAIRQTGESLRDRDQLGVTQYAEGLAEQIERISDYVMTSNVGQLVEEAENFARREPVIFLGGAFLLGMVGARFLKASAPAPAYSGGYLDENSYDYIRDEPRPAYGERQTYGGSYGTREGVRTQQQYSTGTARENRSGQTSGRDMSAGGTYGTGSSYGSSNGNRNYGSDAGTGSRPTGGTYGSGTSTGGTYGSGTSTGGTYGSGTSTGGTYGSGTSTGGTYGSGTSTGGTYGSGTSTGGTYGSGTSSSGTGTGGTHGSGSGTGGGLHVGSTVPSTTSSTGGTFGSGTGAVTNAGLGTSTATSTASVGGGAGSTGGAATTSTGSGLEGDINKSGTTLPGTGKAPPDKGAGGTGKS